MDNPCLTGELNISITSSSALLLGSQIGSMLKGGIVGIAANCDNRLYIIKYALISGIASTGCKIYDLKHNTLPVLRHTVSMLHLDFGIYLHISGDTIDITLTDKNCCDLSAHAIKSLQKTFLSYCEADAVSPIIHVQSSYLHYIAYLDSQIPLHKKPFSVICKNPIVNNIVSDIFYESSKDNLFIAKIHENGETAEYYSEKGIPLSDEQITAVFCSLIFKYGFAKEFVAPISRSCVLEDIASKFQGRIIRCKTDKTDIMNTLASNSLKVQFSIMFDACYSLLFLSQCLAKECKTLKEFTDTLPEIHVYEQEVECGLAQKKHILKAFAEAAAPITENIKNGIRIKNKDSLIMIISHNEKPACRIIAEGKSEEYAKELVNIYVKKAQKIIDGENKYIHE